MADTTTTPPAAAQEQVQLDGSPIDAKEAQQNSGESVRLQIFAYVRDRSKKGLHFLNVAQPVDEVVQNELQERGFRVYNGKYAALIEWD